ncbi:hypothetical protein EOD42_23625 [Rhodovarius crocodyli]|uniref:Lipoprotein n=1 Tax=Rhodovarius crocodyli TaxID=1979269 RepID=A0A437LZ78_9PROT|nr:hypothetical protein [Rhodovarius crocodyli]RVT90623.1 hypothetical protein EOD42_23625 [Rhodovarius crocodyli]
MIRALPLLLLLAACASPNFAASGGSGDVGSTNRDRAAYQASCRDQANRVLERQDRGQLMREDERTLRGGTDAGNFGIRSNLDQLGRQYRRDQLMTECMRQGAPTVPDRAARQ